MTIIRELNLRHTVGFNGMLWCTVHSVTRYFLNILFKTGQLYEKRQY